MAKEQQQPINGFDLDLEIQALKKRQAEGKDPLLETQGNVYGWVSEYLLEMKVFKNPTKIDEAGNLINSISGVRLAHVTNPDERNGKSLQAILDLEEKLSKGKEGDVAVIASSNGQSQDIHGNSIHLKDTQLYLFKKQKDGGIDSVTVVVDNDVYDNTKLLQNLGNKRGGVEQNSEYDLACEIAGIVTYIPKSERDLSLEDMISEVSRARQERNRPLSDKVRKNLVEGIQNRETYSTNLDRANRIAAVHFGEFQNFVMGRNFDNEFDQKAVKREMKKMLLNIAYEIQDEIGDPIIQRSLNKAQKAKTYAFLGTRAGCNDLYGGMGNVGGLFGSRLGFYNDTKSQISFMKNGEYYVSINGQEIKGIKCFECNAVTICGSKCFRCNRRLMQAA